MAAPGASAADSAASRPVASPEDANRLQPLTIGFLEDVVVFPGNLRLKAKIDTGAKSSSLDALNILPFKKDGADWVRFSVAGDLEEVWRFRLPVVRTVGIKRAGAPTLRRYVVELSVCLGPIQKKTEVNLINRSGMNYRMLIGRLFLAGDFLVDPGAAFVTSTTCAGR
ncbi:MAG: ATP-dependent zinc protease [Gammaproteobacteria bacterium]|jgi:hypothetical protein